MSGICSKHRGYRSACTACNTFLENDPFWIMKEALAKAAGTCICANCGFCYYKNTQVCPRCNTKRWVSSTSTS